MTELAHRMPSDWHAMDWQAINTARLLAADAVQKAGNGHPGTAMSLAPVAYALYQKVMRHNPADPHWSGRDRFVLSVGHSSLTQYCQLFLGGFGLEIDDLKALRTWGSATPGHPEYRHTSGVETTTGPLGQGIANAVGMAMAARRERGLLDPETPLGESIFDHEIYCLAGDGCLQEGISAEACSLAGTQQLGNLTLIWDDNSVTIEDDTVIAFTEDVCRRYEAYGWHVQTVDWKAGGGYVEDVESLCEALENARLVTDKPSFIRVRTIIGYPCATKAGTAKVHGAALGADEIVMTKQAMGFPSDEQFFVPEGTLEHTRALRERGQALQDEWQVRFDAWRAAHPEKAELLDRMATRELPQGWDADLPFWQPDTKGIATRAASGEVLNAVAARLPELWGGSADLAGSNNTTMKGEPSFLPTNRQSDEFRGNPYGRTLHFGVREHAMGGLMNGVLQHGGTRIYGGTFFVFSDYMRPAVRLAALMKLPAIYVWTHDSIGVGEDGPTHQPIEHLSAYRAVPGLDVVRPADANETVACWEEILGNTDRPAALILSRQNVPVLPRETDGFAGLDGVRRGGYVLKDSTNPQVVLIATGSEVQLAVSAQEQLATEGISARVVSMPCREWFDAQDQEYRDSVIPPSIEARVVVEAGISMCWQDLLGRHGVAVSLEHFGASASGEVLYEKFGLTSAEVREMAKKTLEASQKTS